MNFDFSPDQQIALERVGDWHERRHTQYITLGGYAGTGKTSLTSYLARCWASTAVVALCGKAAHVLRQKGVDAKTVHSLIYVPFENDEGKVRYRKREYLEGVRRIIVDEASMIDHLLLQDLLSFELPVLFVGDHGQLEPIGTNPNLMKDPVIRLEQIHRQAASNPILRLATAFREGRDVPYWSDPNGRLRVLSKREFHKLVRPEVQIICGYNKTRHQVNARIREMQGFTDELPQPGERLICLRNNKEYGIFNGQQFTCLGVSRARKRFLDIDLQYEDGSAATIPCLREQFGQNLFADHKDKDIALMDFGYCLTAHKSQGSEWPNVLVFEEIAGAWNPQRWRYTVATRAKEQLTYCA